MLSDELGRDTEGSGKQRSLDLYYLDCAKKILENRSEPCSRDGRGLGIVATFDLVIVYGEEERLAYTYLCHFILSYSRCPVPRINPS
jgi:hypothetical protein